MLKLYNSSVSGNCYKVRLLLTQLGLDYETVEIDVAGSDPRPARLLELHPLGKVPLLELEDGTALAESGAILWHLARGTVFLPDDHDLQTEVLRWMFFEQNLHEPSIAVSRFLIGYLRKPEKFTEVIRFNDGRGNQALAEMDRHLKDHRFFVGERYGVADIALYGYTHCADEGNFDLERYPNVVRWLGRVRDQPRHVPM